MVEILIIIVFVLAITSCSLQFSLFPQRKIMWACLGLISAFIYFMYDRAIEQSFSVFKKILSNSSLMVDFTVVQVTESIVGLLISVSLIGLYYNMPMKKYLKFFVYFPGLILFPALFYAESYIFLNVAGLDFQVLAIILAIAFPLVLFMLKALIVKLIPDYDLRLELKFGIHIIQLICAIIISVLINKLPVKASKLSFGLDQLLVLSLGVLIFSSVGILLYNYRMNKLINKH